MIKLKLLVLHPGNAFVRNSGAFILNIIIYVICYHANSKNIIIIIVKYVRKVLFVN